MKSEETAARWIDSAGFGDTDRAYTELPIALAMLRDAKAELEKAEPVFNHRDGLCECTVYPRRDGAVIDCAGSKLGEFDGWSAIEKKFQDGAYG